MDSVYSCWVHGGQVGSPWSLNEGQNGWLTSVTPLHIGAASNFLSYCPQHLCGDVLVHTWVGEEMCPVLETQGCANQSRQLGLRS